MKDEETMNTRHWIEYEDGGNRQQLNIDVEAASNMDDIVIYQTDLPVDFRKIGQTNAVALSRFVKHFNILIEEYNSVKNDTLGLLLFLRKVEPEKYNLMKYWHDTAELLTEAQKRCGMRRVLEVWRNAPGLLDDILNEVTPSEEVYYFKDGRWLAAGIGGLDTLQNLAFDYFTESYKVVSDGMAEVF